MKIVFDSDSEADGFHENVIRRLDQATGALMAHGCTEHAALLEAHSGMLTLAYFAHHDKLPKAAEPQSAMTIEDAGPMCTCGHAKHLHGVLGCFGGECHCAVFSRRKRR